MIDLVEEDVAGRQTPNRGPNRFPWYAVYVRPNYERKVAQALEEKGYDVFLPTYRVVSRWSDRVVEADRPLFAGYTFGRFDVEKRLPILQTPGVIQILGQGKTPVPLPEEQVEAVRKTLTAEAGVRPYPFLKAGQRVRIQKGPLGGLEGILVKRKGSYKLVVSVDLLQRSIAAEVHVADIRPS
jgi:transcription antitermination factor NusG